MHLDLIDIKLTKIKLTWNSLRIGLQNMMARLDRFLVRSEFSVQSFSLSSKALAWGGLDHRPIVLELHELIYFGLLPFQFNPPWPI